MIPLLTLGPVRLSTYGFGLLCAVFLWWTWSERRARAQGLDVPDWLFPIMLCAAWCGGRLGAIDTTAGAWAMLTQLGSVRVFEYSWWTATPAVLGLLYVLRGRLSVSLQEIVACAAVPMLVAYGIATMAATVGGTALGLPTTDVWGVSVFGTTRHAAGWYSAIVVWAGALWIHRRARSTAWTVTAFVGVLALNELLTANVRSESLRLPGGIAVAAVVGLLVWSVVCERVMMPQDETT